MYGAELIRRRMHLQKQVVADAVGITTTTLKLLEEEVPGSMSLYIYLSLAEYYGVTIDDLLEEYPDDAAGLGAHPPTESGREQETNCLTWYRRAYNLSFHELATLLGKNHRYFANKACAELVAREEYVEILAAREGISPDEFRARYSKSSVEEFRRPVIDAMETGENIRKMRLSRGLLVADVQRHFNYDTPQAIYWWERGAILPTADALYALSKLFCVKMDDIIVGG